MTKNGRHKKGEVALNHISRDLNASVLLKCAKPNFITTVVAGVLKIKDWKVVTGYYVTAHILKSWSSYRLIALTNHTNLCV